MNSTIVGVLSATVAACLTWALFVAIYKPTNQTFLTFATSQYFHQMSDEGLTSIASYKDCRLDRPDEAEAKMGVAMFGLCKTESDIAVFHYAVALSPTAGFVYSSFDRVPKP